jgi:TRAP-type uncharacterized transport system fused permease subunit
MAEVFKEGWFYLLPLAILIYFLVFAQYPPEISAFYSMLVMFVMGLFVDINRKRLSVPSLLDAKLRLNKLVFGILGGMMGFLIVEVNWMKRFLLMAGGVMIMIPGWRTGVSGTMIILVIGLWILLTKKGKEDYYEV